MNRLDVTRVHSDGGAAHRLAANFLLALAAVLIVSNGNADTELDFSHVDSREKAEALAERGQLFKILLFPAEFGGEDVPPNTVYVPAGIPEIKDRITQTLIRYVQDGLIDNLSVNPEYKGNSLVPSRIVLETSLSGEPGQFNPTIEIW